VRCNAVLRPVYQRLPATGKPTKLALVAVMNKLLLILNEMLKTKTAWRRHAPPPKRAGLPTSPQGDSLNPLISSTATWELIGLATPQ
jgi:hypothetical protein